MFQLYFTFLKIGSLMLGGGYSMLPLLVRELVDKKKWTTEEELLNYFSVAQCTPGVIAVNTATFVGYKLKGIWGAILATLGIITVPFALIVLIAVALSSVWEYQLVQNIFAGVRIAVAALIISAVIRLFSKSIKDWFSVLLCVAAFALMVFAGVSPIFIVLGAAIVALVWGRVKP
ncbi:MAG: chromate transporter [Eubacteriales bacterium]|nr:chromate transporter [Eubacteriales bacterium]